MKRAVICVPNPHDYIDQLNDYSIMIVNPTAPHGRQKYLLDHADWSLKITPDSVEHRPEGKDYGDERLLWYTSGTVGDSKFYSFSQAQLDLLCKSIIDDLEITANDRYMGIMSLWHAHGQSLFWATRQAGCETQFVAVNQVRQLANFQPTFVSAIPDLLKVIGELPLSKLRFIRSGSAPLDTNLYHDLLEKFQVPVIEYFGMTEAMSHVLSNPLHGPSRPGTVGLPTQRVRAKIEQGSLWIQSAQAYTQTWFDTGDLAEQDKHGYFKILGRRVEQINIRGYKINPGSIEQQVRELLPALESVIIFGSSECNCVYVGSVDAQQVSRALQQIHPACFPKFIKQIEEIPKPDSGKMSRIWLQQHFECK
jgi:acyl-coenzyme A synthetase/AMP-(fatty) acid ligase